MYQSSQNLRGAFDEDLDVSVGFSATAANQVSNTAQDETSGVVASRYVGNGPLLPVPRHRSKLSLQVGDVLHKEVPVARYE